MFPDNPIEMLLPGPDPAFRLSQEERSIIPSNVDAGTAEQFLAWIKPEYREMVKPLLLSSATIDASKPAVAARSRVEIQVSHPEVVKLVRRLFPNADEIAESDSLDHR